jgi:NADH dehydrogenase/NADH:ubiquinone oxidoreductase subunit G
VTARLVGVIAAIALALVALDSIRDGVQGRADARVAAAQAKTDSAATEAALARAGLARAQEEASALRDSLEAVEASTAALVDSLSATAAAAVSSSTEAAGDLVGVLGQIREALPEGSKHLADTARARVASMEDAALVLGESVFEQQMALSRFRTTSRAALGAMEARALHAEGLAEAIERQMLAERAAKDAALAAGHRGFFDKLLGSIPLVSTEATVGSMIGLVVGVAVSR